MSAHRAESLASSWHSRAKSHRSPLMRSVLLALASATNRRMAVSASRPIAEYSPLRERERPMVIFIFLGECGVLVETLPSLLSMMTHGTAGGVVEWRPRGFGCDRAAGCRGPSTPQTPVGMTRRKVTKKDSAREIAAA